MGTRRSRGFIERVRAGGGFVKYYFEKEGKGIQPKLAYVTRIPGTDFFVGSGVYIDNIEAERGSLFTRLATQERRIAVYAAVVFVLILGTIVALTLLLSNTFTREIGRIVLQLRRGSEQVAAASAEFSAQSRTLVHGPTGKPR